ncbi:MAG: GNAT family N-acetyltransferase [Betaproteobacteria bacterium]|nr:GNAT family N-acetyltransferase [Betaproteobacteria bacterium]
MSNDGRIKPVPWDSAAFGIDCYELIDPDAALVARAISRPGHYTAKVDPLADKRFLHDAGFYYCDTLIEPWCTADKLAHFDDAAVTFSDRVPLDPLAAICRSAFLHGRFHRDFNIERGRADRRYENWLGQLYGEGRVLGLLYNGDVAGFIAHMNGSLVLHAMGEAHRGRGLAKFFWSAVCRHLFAQGQREIRSSISFVNIAVINLYSALGFRFRKPVDIYHRVVP